MQHLKQRESLEVASITILAQIKLLDSLQEQPHVENFSVFQIRGGQV